MAKEPATKPKKDKNAQAKKSLLKRSVKTPGSDKLSRKVHAPKWLRATGGYFVGAWHELREVRWPTRRATWGLTAAVLLFSAVLGLFIIGLDLGFEQLFKRIIL